MNNVADSLVSLRRLQVIHGAHDLVRVHIETEHQVLGKGWQE